MKFLKSLSRRALSSKNLKDRSESTRTVSLEEEKELLSHRRVRFSAQGPTYYDCDPYSYCASTSGCGDHPRDEDRGDSEMMVLWYDESDIEVFQRDSMHQVQQQQQQQRHQQRHQQLVDDKNNEDDGNAVVATCIMTSYQACQTIDTRQGMEDLLLMAKRHAMSLSSSIVGLEKWISPEMQKSRVQQRQQLLRNVRRLQTKKKKTPSSSSSSSSSKESELRSLCVRASQPARLFAQYVAVLSQHANDDE